MKVRVFWGIASYSFDAVDRRFRGTYYPHHHRDHAPLKRPSTPMRTHGAISQKTLTFILASCVYCSKSVLGTLV